MGPVTRSFQAQVLWTAYKQGYHLTLSLKTARHVAHTLGACQNHTHFGPQIAPSGNLPQACLPGTCKQVAVIQMCASMPPVNPTQTHEQASMVEHIMRPPNGMHG